MTVDFVERVLGAWTAALDWAADKDVLLVVTHDGPIRVLLRELGHVDATDVPVFGITTGATYWLRYHRGGWKLSGDQSDPLWTS
jgi:broad specificity phosphatase PhoE